MAKAVVVKDKASSAVKNLNPTKKKKKKEFWKKHPKIAGKEEKTKNVTPVLPPKTPQEFSANWKALQTLLKPESSSPVPIANKPTNKPDKGMEKEEKVNGKEKPEPKPKNAATKINGHVKETLTAEKKRSKGARNYRQEERDKEAKIIWQGP